jgi:hypothetical protein
MQRDLVFVWRKKKFEVREIWRETLEFGSENSVMANEIRVSAFIWHANHNANQIRPWLILIKEL